MAAPSISERSTRPVAVLAAATGMAAFLWTMLVVSGRTDEVDHALMMQAGALRAAYPGLVDPAWLVTRTGDGMSRLVVALLGAGMLWRAGLSAKALWLLASVCGGLLLTPLLKGLIERPRPDVLVHLDKVSDASYPSGHTLGAMILALSLGLLFRSSALRIILGAYVVMVAISRVILGVHWPSDIVGGLLFGACWTLTGYSLWLVFGAPRSPSSRLRE